MVEIITTRFLLSTRWKLIIFRIVSYIVQVRSILCFLVMMSFILESAKNSHLSIFSPFYYEVYSKLSDPNELVYQ